MPQFYSQFLANKYRLALEYLKLKWASSFLPSLSGGALLFKFPLILKTSESFRIIYIFIFEVTIVATYAIATTTFSMRGLLR